MIDPPLFQEPARSLYVHIPFCQSRCFYCDFTTYVADSSVKAAYVARLIREIEMIAATLDDRQKNTPLSTIFFGGGTPTMLSDREWKEIATAITTTFSLDEQVEWTVEANPGSTAEQLYPTLRAIGVNRISFGAQTFSEGLLQTIGRLHDARDVMRAVKLAKEAGFRRISLDLMLGLPEQTLVDVKEALDACLSLDVSHISAYGLKIEEGTPFADWQRKGLLPLPDEEDEVAMYEMVRSVLHGQGFRQYEISNFAKNGEEARHNLTYWRNLPYLAVGAGAHGYVHGERYENVKSLHQYAALIDEGRLPRQAQTVVLMAEAMEDEMMLGLRLEQGVVLADFYRHFGVHAKEVFAKPLHSLRQKGWIAEDEQRIWIDPTYYEVSNAIIAAFIQSCEDFVPKS